MDPKPAPSPVDNLKDHDDKGGRNDFDVAYDGRLQVSIEQLFRSQHVQDHFAWLRNVDLPKK